MSGNCSAFALGETRPEMELMVSQSCARYAGETPHAAPTLIEQLQSVPTFSVEQAAKALGISKAYAYLLVQRGELPVIRLGGKRVRVPTSALRRMMGVEDAA